MARGAKSSIAFDMHNALQVSGTPTLPECLRSVSRTIERFLSRLETLPLDGEAYLVPRDPDELLVLWERVETLASLAWSMTDAPATREQSVQPDDASNGVVVSKLEAPRSLKPIVGALRQAVFALTRTGDGRWVDRVLLTTAGRLRALSMEMNEHANSLDPAPYRDAPTGTAAAPNVPNQPLAPQKTPGAKRSVGRDEARLKAEAIVKAEGFPVHRSKPSVRRLAERAGCSFSTMRKAIAESPKLQRARAQAGGSPPASELDRLMAEQKLDDRSRHA